MPQSLVPAAINDGSICKGCDNPYLPSRHGQRYCTSLCRCAAHKRKVRCAARERLNKLKIKYPSYCVECFDTFIPPTLRALTCGTLCTRIRSGRLYRDNPLNKEKHSVSARNWHMKRMEDPTYVEHRRVITNRYAKANKVYYAEVAARRRARIRLAIPSWFTTVDSDKYKDLVRERNHLSKLHNEPYHIDHIIPLLGKDVCGLHCIDNWQILRGIDNLRKGIKYDG